MADMKRCSKCGEQKPLEDFSRRKKSATGRTSACKVCNGSKQKLPPLPDGMKRCKGCEKVLPLDAFYNRKKSKDGKQFHCKVCKKTYDVDNQESRTAYGHSYHEANREAIAEKYRIYYEANKKHIATKSRAYREENKEVIAQRQLAYREANREVIAARSLARYRACKPPKPPKPPKPLQQNGMKICTKCSEVKPLEEFWYDSSRPDGKQSTCIACKSSANRAYNKANPEKQRAYHAANREAKREYSKDYYKANRDAAAAYSKAYARAHKEEASVRRSRRRALVRNAFGSHTAADIRKQYKTQKGKCYYCNSDVGDNYHVDHVIPLSRGGSNGQENIVIACPFCNHSKKDKLPSEWAEGGRLI